MDDSKPQIRNPKYQIGPPVHFDISDFGFEVCYRPFSFTLVWNGALFTIPITSEENR